MTKAEMLEDMEKTIGTFKFKTIKNLLKMDIILAGAKVGTLLSPTVNILGFIVPQYVIALLFIGAGTTVMFKPEKKQQEAGLIPSNNRSRF